MIQSSQGFSLPGGWKYQAGEKKKNLGLFQLHKLLPEASKCCKKHIQIFRFKFNQIPGHLDLFECQHPPSFPSCFRLLYISECFLFSVSAETQSQTWGLQGLKESNKIVPCLPRAPAHYTPALAQVKTAPVIYVESKLKSRLFTDAMLGLRVLF